MGFCVWNPLGVGVDQILDCLLASAYVHMIVIFRFYPLIWTRSLSSTASRTLFSTVLTSSSSTIDFVPETSGLWHDTISPPRVTSLLFMGYICSFYPFSLLCDKVLSLASVGFWTMCDSEHSAYFCEYRALFSSQLFLWGSVGWTLSCYYTASYGGLFPSIYAVVSQI